jgi:hypothetical protein
VRRLCEAHVRADVVALAGGAFRFCCRCHKTQALACFSGSRKACDASLERYNAKRRERRRTTPASAAAAGDSALNGTGSGSDTGQLAVPRLLGEEANEAVPVSLEGHMHVALARLLACIVDNDTRMMAAGAAEPAAPVTVTNARLLRAFFLPVQAALLPAFVRDTAELYAARAAMSADDAADSRSWCSATAALTARADDHVAYMQGVLGAFGGEISVLRVMPLASSPDVAYLAALVEGADAFAMLVSHAAANLALLRLESRGRHVAAAALVCSHFAAVVANTTAMLERRIAWLTARAAAQGVDVDGVPLTHNSRALASAYGSDTPLVRRVRISAPAIADLLAAASHAAAVAA